MPSDIKKSTSFKSFPPPETKNEVAETDDGSIIFEEVPPLSVDEVKLLTESAEFYSQKKKIVTRGNSESPYSPNESGRPKVLFFSGRVCTSQGVEKFSDRARGWNSSHVQTKNINFKHNLNLAKFLLNF